MGERGPQGPGPDGQEVRARRCGQKGPILTGVDSARGPGPVFQDSLRPPSHVLSTGSRERAPGVHPLAKAAKDEPHGRV